MMELIKDGDREFKAGLGEESKAFFDVYPDMKDKIEKVVAIEKKKKDEAKLAQKKEIRERPLFDPFSGEHRQKLPTVGIAKKARTKGKMKKPLTQVIPYE